MLPGNTCMIQITNAMKNLELELGFWKLWKAEKRMRFYYAKSLTETEDNNLEAVTDAGTTKQIKKGETLYLLAVNPTRETLNFNLQFASAAVLVGTPLVALALLI